LSIGGLGDMKINKKKLERMSDSHHITITFLVIFGIIMAAIYFMSYSGILDSRSGDAVSIGNFICFATGHFDGMDNIVKNDDYYSFNCSIKNVTVEYNFLNNTGFIKWPKE
jgi:hypothetical protein